MSSKRRDILRLPLAEYRKWADEAAPVLLRVVTFLHGERIFTARDLPYATQLVKLTAIMAALGDRADSHGVVVKLRQWFWCGVFGEMYGSSTETRFATDLPDVLAWVNGGAEPRTVKESQFQADRLMTLRTRQQDRHRCPYRSDDRRLGGEPIPGADRGERADPGQELDAILRSHDIDPLALRADDFPAFFTARFERLLKQIEEGHRQAGEPFRGRRQPVRGGRQRRGGRGGGDPARRRRRGEHERRLDDPVRRPGLSAVGGASPDRSA